MFTLLKPHVSTLVEHFIFPLVCLSEEELELFTDDPTEFARQSFGGASALSPFRLGARTRSTNLTSTRRNRLYRRPVRLADQFGAQLPVCARRDPRKDDPPSLAPVHPVGRRQVRPRSCHQPRRRAHTHSWPSFRYPATITPRQKDGALRMLGALATTAVKSVRPPSFLSPRPLPLPPYLETY